jgi:hypothetical protein
MQTASAQSNPTILYPQPGQNFFSQSIPAGVDVCVKVCLDCVNDPNNPSGYCKLWAWPLVYEIDGGYCEDENSHCDYYRFSGPLNITFELFACDGSQARIYWYEMFPIEDPCPWFP